MIVTPENMTFAEKKFSMILYGSPGVGKTTLALSAPKPVIIDFDRGMSRVKAYHRKDAIFCDNYKDVLTDIASPAMSNYETIIIDTGGSFVTFLQEWAMEDNPTLNKQKNGALSMKGFGAVKNEFIHFTSKVKDTLNKNLIYVFHSVEQSDKDGNTQVRLMCEGSTKNIVWTPCDFGGYVQMIGQKRIISFTPEQEFFAKGCHGIEGQMTIPTAGPNDTNDFLTRLFDKARANIEAENEVFAPMREQYERVMNSVRSTLAGITTLEQINLAVSDFPKFDHALTSKKESSVLLNQKASELGFKWSKEAGAYVKVEG